MELEFRGKSETPGANGALATIVFEDALRAGDAAALNETTGGALERALTNGRFTGAVGQTLELLAPHGIEVGRLVLVGAGKQSDFDSSAAELAAAKAFRAVRTSGVETLVIRLTGLSPALASRAALGVTLAAYRFDKYRTTEKAEKKPSVKAVWLAVDRPSQAAKAWERDSAIASGVLLARDLVSEPANVLFPEEFARRVKKLASLGLEIEILGEKEMRKLGMGSLLGVGQGSVRESQLAVIQWKGAKDPNSPPIAFVGKGVCFDTGGISLKPADGMEEMITDMGGAAAVTGTLAALAGRKAKVNAVGILGLVENMPDGAAQRPGDVVTSMSGQTIEVINTDAEGRLVLADALWYCQDRFKPRAMIDLATLTGAIVIALGKDLAGLYCNSEPLAEHLLAASKASRDALWRMPLPAQYERQIESGIADVKNTGGRPGGSITAALFLQKFVNGAPWAHLDIASTAWKPNSTIPTIPSGATGFGVRLLDQLVADHYEG
ncbi:MAG TPA: leucyl aminopeptidase [Caulobacteraceae bacterium]|jgi:leucyl aminopeptidase